MSELDPPAAGSPEAKQDGKGQAETLASEEVVELQAFIERREWIEEKTRLLEKMPPIEVFAGARELAASSTTPVTGLPTREELAEWVAEHDRIEQEAEQFDAGDMSRLKNLTKAATQRNLSREDTDLIEVTLTTLFALDKLIHLLRDRDENLNLMGTRLDWEQQRMFAWNERARILSDLQTFLTARAQWSPSTYDQPPPVVHTPMSRRLSNASGTSGMSGMSGMSGPPPDAPPSISSVSMSTSRSSFSRGSRFMLAEALSLDAAQFTTRLHGLNKSVTASGKTLDKLIESSHRKPVPDQLLDEQDKLENESAATEGLGKFAMAMVMQWKKSDEIYGELRKDLKAAQTLKDEIENAKLQHPNQKFDDSFTARSAALTAKLAVIGDPATSRSFPRPMHPLFPTQGEANGALTKLLSKELAITAKAVREAAAAAGQYHDVMHSINEVERLRDSMIALTSRLEAVAKHFTDGIPSQDGDGSIPNVEDASCLSPTRHGAFLALLPTTLKEHDAAEKEAQQAKAQCKVILLKVGAANVDPDLKTGVLAVIQRLENQQELTHAARKDVHARIEVMREARNLKTSIDTVQETTINLRRQIIRAIQRQRWKPQRVQDGRPLTPESPEPATMQSSLTPSDAFLQADVLTTQAASLVEKPLAVLSPSLGASLSSTLSDMHKSLAERIQEVRRLASLWESIKRQFAAMDLVRKEAHDLEASFADLIYRYDAALELSTEESCAYKDLAAREKELQAALDETTRRAHGFTGTLSTRVPFIASSEHSATFTVSSSSNSDSDAPGRLPFALISIDDAVRADANAYSVSISGSLAVLAKKNNYLKIALLAQDFENFKQPVLQEINETTDFITTTRATLNGFEALQDGAGPQATVLETLTALEKQINTLAQDYAPRINSKLASVRHVLAKMSSAPGGNDSFIQERLVSHRSRELEKIASMAESASRDLSALVARVTSSKLLEARRLEAEQARVLADLRAKEEAEKRAQLEAEIARFALEEAKRKEIEEIRRLEAEKAKEAARLADEERQREREVEQARAKAEREAEALERQRAREEEQARAESERRRLEAEAEAHRQAEANARRELEENRKREHEMYSKIAAEREARDLETRKRRDTETERIAEEMRLRAEVARQEAEISRLEEEIRRDQAARKSLDHYDLEDEPDEFGVMPSSNSASALVVMSPDGKMEGTEIFGKSDSHHSRNLSEDMIQLQSRIGKIRAELRDIGINALARPSLNAPFPVKDEVDKMRVRFLELQREQAKLPDSASDTLINAELTSLRFEVDNSVILMAHLTRLVEFTHRLTVCDGALSELLNHVDSFPALPAAEDTVHHFSDPKETPKAQMSARLKFTEEVINKLKSCAESLTDDGRVMEESNRIKQTWGELFDMANDCLIEMPSRPSTAASLSSATSTRRRGLVPSASDPSPLDLSTRRGPSTPRNRIGPQTNLTSSQSSSGARRPSSRISNRSVSGPLLSTPKTDGQRPSTSLRVRQRTTSTSSSAASGPVVTGTSSRLLASTFSSRQRAHGSTFNPSPLLRPESRRRSHANLDARTPSPSPPVRAPSRNGNGTWGRVPKSSFGATLPRNFKPPSTEHSTPKPRRTYVPNPTNKLDVAVGAVVNQLPVEINIEALTDDGWKDQSGKYWIGDEEPKLCYCRILRSSTVMVRVGGGWVELSKFIKDHFAHLFRLLPVTTPPHVPQDEGPRWISSTTLQEDNEDTPTKPPRQFIPKPTTPEPRRAPSRASPSPVPSFRTPTGISPQGGTSSSHSSPLTPIQFMRRADDAGPRARPTSPLSRTVRGRGQSNGLSRPLVWK
ncbi:hypothetical protein RhiJN_01040 [Ceratobasidium sp. AG-Ba]|nr:hypothetical protein RhiJN_01040 [Ceratobasidium sp. AG-Ba]